MGHRREAREIALQVLYEIDVLQIGADEALELFWSNFDAPGDAREFSTNSYPEPPATAKKSTD